MEGLKIKGTNSLIFESDMEIVTCSFDVKKTPELHMVKL